MPGGDGAEAAAALRIAELGPEHYLLVLELLHSGFQTVATEFGITAQNTPSNPAFWPPGSVERVVGRGFEAIGAWFGSDLAGCVFRGPLAEDGAVSMRHLSVAPGLRHRGVGRALVAETAARARRAGARSVSIGIVGENIRLRDWYHALGFRTVAADLHYPGLVFSVERLVLDLTSPGPLGR